MYNARIINRGPYSGSSTANVDYLVVGGGGGGGSDMGGGGGAGGFISGSVVHSTFDKITITVGAGANGANAGTNQGTAPNGSTTFVTSSQVDIRAFGGGGGSSDHDNPTQANNGASGGGSAGRYNRQGSAIYTGSPYFNLGNAGGGSAGAWYPGSGGGAGAAGRTQPADGGAGLPLTFVNILKTNDTEISGSDNSIFFSGGGAGAGYSARAGNGGIGGGGGGGPKVSGGGLGDTNSLYDAEDAPTGTLGSQTNVKGGNGAQNSGGGGGGSSHYNSNNPGGQGGSGIVVLRTPLSKYSGDIFIPDGRVYIDNQFPGEEKQVVMVFLGSGYYKT